MHGYNIGELQPTMYIVERIVEPAVLIDYTLQL